MDLIEPLGPKNEDRIMKTKPLSPGNTGPRRAKGRVR